MAVSLQMTVFWDIVPCSVVEMDLCSKRVYCLIHRPDDGGSTQLSKASLLVRDYTALYPTMMSSAANVTVAEENLD